MRIRRKPWARPELAACPFCIDEPEKQLGHWHQMFEREQPLHLELGCGKGGFMAQKAVANPDINFLAVDIKSAISRLPLPSRSDRWTTCASLPMTSSAFCRF